jgi:hypothetical protein
LTDGALHRHPKRNEVVVTDSRHAQAPSEAFFWCDEEQGYKVLSLERREEH